MSRFDDQLESLYGISVEIARLRALSDIYDLALTYCLALTESEMGFIDLINEDRIDMDVVAVKGFSPPDPKFYERFKRMPIRPSVFGKVITAGRPNISNDVENDPERVGQPPGHPQVRTFLGVPLSVGEDLIGMIGVANKEAGYGPEDQRLLSTFANQVALAIDNAMLHQRDREMITRLQQLHHHLTEAEREQLVALERERTAASFRLEPKPARPKQPRLNNSQREILELMTEGLSNREIASQVHLSENTVKSHIQEILRKVEARNRVQAAVRAAREGWV
ncbi:MAG TPA: GAF domain-containing protein [Solirubrobacteraceae bacterium]|jgi:GAF domain-containing protein|nr:GAF domain-containing protein [Solirubrobacteraceae bacterium]